MWQYNNELYHYGVLGMKWGQHLYNARDRYENRLNRYQQRSQKYANILSRPRNANQMAKAEKYNAKWLKAERKARRARRKANSGRELSIRQTNKIMRAEKLKAKTNKYEGYNANIIAKKAKADYKINKYKRKIERVNKRIKTWEMNKGTIDKGKTFLNDMSYY